MSQHQTAQSNWTAEQKQLYRERRQKGLRGQLGYANVYRTVKDDDGHVQLVPVGFRRGPGASTRLTSGGSNKLANPNFTKKGAWRVSRRLAAQKAGLGA